MKDSDLRKAMQLASKIFLDINENLEQWAVAGQPVEPKQQSSLKLDEHGIGLREALNCFKEKILSESIKIAHPMYFGLVNSSPLPGAALADLLVSALNNNAGAQHQSPGMSACEEEVIRTFIRMFRFPSSSVGMVLPGGTYANLQALVLARESKKGKVGNRRLYVSAESHFSVTRSAFVAGFLSHEIVTIPTIGRGILSVEILKTQIQRDINNGLLPLGVVATIGTTGTGAIDPVPAIADLCKKYSLWLHVDACYGGAAVLLKDKRRYFEGVELADSLSVDPHKWFFVPLTAAILLTPHKDLEARTFDIDVSYIPTDKDQVDFWQRGIPTSRRCSGFTIWMALKAYGLSFIRETVDRNIQLTGILENTLISKGFNVLPGSQLSVCCARWEPSDLAARETDRFQTRISQLINQTGKAWFSTVKYQGKVWLRFNIVNLHTQERHVSRLVALLTDSIQKLAKAHFWAP